MKSFLQYIIEANDDKSKLRRIAKLKLQELFPDIKMFISERDRNEIFRASLGYTKDDVLNKLKLIYVDEQCEFGEFEIFGRTNGASSKYNSIELTYNGKKYYIATTDNEKGLLKNKDLTPDKLGIPLADEFTTCNDLIGAMNLDQIEKKSETIAQWLKTICDVVAKHSTENKTGCFAESSIEKFILSDNAGKIEIPFPKETTQYFRDNRILKGDIACILKDFGEIVGPLMFLSTFDKVTIKYCTISNEPMVDYYVNGCKISAKAHAGGGKPSGANIMLLALANIDLYTPEEQLFIEDVGRTFSMSIFKQQLTLIDKFVLAKNTKLKKLLNTKPMSFNSWETYSDLVHSLDEYVVKNSAQDLFLTIYQETNYQPAKKDGYTVDTIVKNYTAFSDKQKWGILFYPLYKYAIDLINIQYGNKKLNEVDGTVEKDIITRVIQKTIDMKLIYFSMNENKIAFEVHSSTVSNWKFATGGMSTNNIGNSKMSIAMTK